jgi:hypothetical protein
VRVLEGHRAADYSRNIGRLERKLNQLSYRVSRQLPEEPARKTRAKKAR